MKKFFAILLLAVICSCRNTGNSTGNQTFNLADVKKIIENNNKIYRIAFLSGDSAAFADLHHSATINMPPDAPLMRGRGPMGAMIKTMPSMDITDYKVNTTNVYGGPEDVIEEGKYEIDGQGKVMEKGKYIVIWKSEDGKWKIYRSIWNKDSK
jgi:ketosteroid isomerase-like protein